VPARALERRQCSVPVVEPQADDREVEPVLAVVAQLDRAREGLFTSREVPLLVADTAEAGPDLRNRRLLGGQLLEMGRARTSASISAFIHHTAMAR
jgi:hypothetical protein